VGQFSTGDIANKWVTFKPALTLCRNWSARPRLFWHGWWVNLRPGWIHWEHRIRIQRGRGSFLASGRLVRERIFWVLW